ncbi:MAG: hypothetical protein O7E57_01850, partial [Gammaproteobacteria bacterium]|nr:hypothetical protein [Gammaproteobacteria bacterium]
MYEKASTFAATSRPKIAFRAIASLVVVMTLAACGVEDSAAGVTVSGNQTSLDATLTKNELSFLLTLNASEQAGITELFSELKGWDFQPHQLLEVLRDSVVAEEI